MSDSLEVFVYGTLRHTEPNAWLLDGAIGVQSAVAPGLVLAVPRHRGFPYALEQTGSSIVGELVTIAAADAERVLAQLDQLEGFHPEEPRRSHYLRVRRPVLVDGRSREAWVYLAGPLAPKRGMSLLASGDWTCR